MTMLNIGLNRIRDLVVGDLQKGQLGTDGTASKPSDTDLGSADANAINNLALTTSDKQVNASYVLYSTEGTTTTYKEYKNYNDDDSKNFDRIVFTGISFTTDGTEDIHVTKRYFMTSG